MVKHVILWKLKPEHNIDAVKSAMKEELEKLPSVVPGLVELKVETNPMPTSNADVMLYSVLESEDALKGYAIHPEHVRVADTFVRPFTEARFCFDYKDN